MVFVITYNQGDDVCSVKSFDHRTAAEVYINGLLKDEVEVIDVIEGQRLSIEHVQVVTQVRLVKP